MDLVTATAHALVGGAIASTIPDPVIGISLAVVSHPLLDMVPHWDFGRGWRDKSKVNFLAESLFDMAFGVTLSYFLFARNINPVYFLAVVAASLFFDIIQTPYWFFNWHFAPFSWCYKFGSKINAKAKLPWGILNQAVAVAAITLILKTF